jgi:NAD+ synthase (glutamine-hydrolysing)
VFHETRYFRPAARREPVDLAGIRIGVMICEDMWDEPYEIHPAEELKAGGAEMLIVISASPYRKNVMARRFYHARRHGMPLIYVNAIGAQDELIFDGGSFVMSEKGRITAMLPRFQEAVEVIDVKKVNAADQKQDSIPVIQEPEEVFTALVTGIRGFVNKNGLRQAYVGLSGGIDSALVACLACEALGPQRVRGLILPSRFTDARSTESALELARNLGIPANVISIEPLFEGAMKLLDSPEIDSGTTNENVQCRLRTLILMAHVNRHGGMLLNTSNKTELSLGYGTLYGDMAGALSPLGDVPKMEVYQLATWYNQRRSVIPEFILERKPTAELRADQVDPFEYPTVSPLAERIVNGEFSDEKEYRKYEAMIYGAEHKRWQSSVILKIQETSFGRGRLMPITHGFRHPS